MVYGANRRGARAQLWSDLASLPIASSEPWVLLGNFNDVKHVDEKKGGIGIDTSATQDFNDCLDTLEIFYLSCKGSFNTGILSMKWFDL